MSEYQYYEFLAMDRRLDATDMTRLRSVSSRAKITPTSLSVEYNYGGGRSDADDLLARYFDVHVYLANWGTRCLMMRLPHEVVPAEDLLPYCGEGVTVRRVEAFTLVELWGDTEEPEAWTEGPGWMGALAGVRTALLRGDARPPYLFWLHALGQGCADEDALEPPVPAGLDELPASLTSLVEFLRIDDDLLAAAELASAPAEPEPAGFEEWLIELPPQEKDALLLRMVQGEHATATASLVSRFRKQTREMTDADAPRRTVAELLARAEELREERDRLSAQAVAAARRKREEAAALERTKHLDALATRKPAAWRKVRRLIEAKKAKGYDQAAEQLADLRDLAVREGDEVAFTRRLRGLRTQHARKRNFIARLDQVGLR